MNSTIWLALALVLVLEGLGPMLYPGAWKKMVSALAQLPENVLRRFGGGLVVAGVVVYYMLRKRLAEQKWSDLPHIECKKCCISEKAMVESIFKQTVILKNG